MKLQAIKEKVKSFCTRVGKRNFVIVGAVLLIGAAVAVNVAIIAANRTDNGFDYSQSAGMDGADSTTESTTAANDKDTYFSSVLVNRQRTRDEAIEVLQAVVDNQSATETAKNEALAEINKLAKVMETEANIETLIVAKGFEECVAVISGDKASIVVSSDGLQAAQIAQINEIVYAQSGILPVNITITER